MFFRMVRASPLAASRVPVHVHVPVRLPSTSQPDTERFVPCRITTLTKPQRGYFLWPASTESPCAIRPVQPVIRFAYLCALAHDSTDRRARQKQPKGTHRANLAPCPPLERRYQLLTQTRREPLLSSPSLTHSLHPIGPPATRTSPIDRRLPPINVAAAIEARIPHAPRLGSRRANTSSFHA
jgi:hypothetical protein